MPALTLRLEVLSGLLPATTTTASVSAPASVLVPDDDLFNAGADALPANVTVATAVAIDAADLMSVRNPAEASDAA